MMRKTCISALLLAAIGCESSPSSPSTESPSAGGSGATAGGATGSVTGGAGGVGGSSVGDGGTGATSSSGGTSAGAAGSGAAGSGAAGSGAAGSGAAGSGAAGSGASGGTGGHDYLNRLFVGPHITCGTFSQRGIVCTKPVPTLERKAYRLAIADNQVCVVFADDGSVGCWDYSDPSPEVQMVKLTTGEPLLNMTSISGGGHFCALDAAGDAFCWGNNDHGQVAPNDASQRLSDAVEIGEQFSLLKAGALETCGVLKADGSLKCWGRQGVIAPAPAVPAFDDLVMGKDHACVRDETLMRCWGKNGHNELGYPTAENDDFCGSDTCRTAMRVYLSGIIHEVGAGDETSCAAMSNGRIYCWGNGDDLRLGTDTEVQGFGFRPVSDLAFVATLTTHPLSQHSCVVGTRTGRVWCWGNNDSGQAGCDEATCPPTAHPLFDVPGPTEHTGTEAPSGLDCSAAPAQDACEACAASSCCLKVSYCWGDYDCGQCLAQSQPTCGNNHAFEMLSACKQRECSASCGG